MKLNKIIYGMFLIVGSLVADDFGELKGADSSLCIKVVTTSNSYDGASIKLGTCNNSDETLWSYDETYNHIKSKLDNGEYCLSAYSTFDKNPHLVLKECDTTDNSFIKQWVIRGTNISIKGNEGYVVDAFGNGIGANIGIWEANAGINQQWSTSNIFDITYDDYEDDGESYKVIEGIESGLCMKVDTTNDTPNGGEEIKLANCANNDSLLWKYDENTGLIRSKLNNGLYCMSINHRRTALNLQRCNRDDNLQKWLQKGKQISWMLKQDFVIDAHGESVGNIVALWGYNPDNLAQQWRMYDIEDNQIYRGEDGRQYGQLKELRDSLCLSTSNIADNSPIVLDNCDGADKRLWAYDNNDFLIRNMADNRYCLATKASSSNTKLILKKCDSGSVLQKWILNDKYVLLKNNTSLALDAFGKNIGGDIGLWTFHGNENQKWTTSNIFSNKTSERLSANRLGTLKTYETLVYHQNNDGSYQKGTKRVYKRDDGLPDVVVDGVTNLMWEDDSTVSNKRQNWFSAVEYCNNLTLGYFRDWRVPNLYELKYILDYSKYSPSIDTTTFKNVAKDHYWSSNESFDYKANVWIVDFKDSKSYTESKGKKNYVRCVRGSAIAKKLNNELIRDEYKQTVTDPISDLVWQDDIQAKTVKKNWEDAISYCENLNLGGYNNWYLPNINQLNSIIKLSAMTPAMSTKFQNTASNNYWSSTTANYSALTAWNVSFSDGTNIPQDKEELLHVRCVRDKENVGNLFVYGKLRDSRSSLCMTSEPSNHRVTLGNCTGFYGEVLWAYNKDTGLIRNRVRQNYCLTLRKDIYSPLYMERCNKTNLLQTWNVVQNTIYSKVNYSSINDLLEDKELNVVIDAFGDNIGGDVGAWTSHSGKNQIWSTENFKTDEVVVDNDTGLMWQDNTDNETVEKEWKDAVSYCQSLNLGGHMDWRLPTIDELDSIVDYNSNRYSAIKDIFNHVKVTQGIYTNMYWSSSKYISKHPGYDGDVWAIEFAHGFQRALHGDSSEKGNVRCVRGVFEKIEGDFVRDDEKDVVIDRVHKIMWQDNEDVKSDKKVVHSEAIQYCENLDLAGYNDWHLPNLHQLHSIADKKSTRELKSAFKNYSCTYYWSSNQRILNAYDTPFWAVSFCYMYYNNMFADNKEPLLTRCVRDMD